MLLLLVKSQKHEKGRVLASFCPCSLQKTLKNTEFQLKVKKAAVQEVAKTHAFCNILSSKHHKLRLKLGVFDDFATSKRTKPQKRPSFSPFLSMLLFKTSEEHRVLAKI